MKSSKTTFLSLLAVAILSVGVASTAQAAAPETLVTDAFNGKNASNIKAFLGAETATDGQIKNFMKELEQWGLWDGSGNVRVRNEKIVDGKYAAVAVYCDGPKAQKKGKNHLVFFMKQINGEWVAVEMEDDYSENGKQMTDSNIRYKCTR